MPEADLLSDSLRRAIVGVRDQFEPLHLQLLDRVLAQQSQGPCRHPASTRLARAPVADVADLLLIDPNPNRTNGVVILRNRELVRAEIEAAGDEGLRVITCVRPGDERDPVEDFRILAGDVDTLRVVLTPRSQDDPIAVELHAW